MINRFLSFIKAHGLCDTETTVLLAVSSGVDSMVMLHLFQKAGIPHQVAHCNFMLRGAASEADEIFVKQICSSFNVICHVQRFNVQGFMRKHKQSLQMAARSLRYDWFESLLQSTECSVVATAHHINDSIETVILNFTRGADYEGMQGITPKSHSRIRPMLFATRSEILEYAQKHQVPWREDESNDSLKYERNLVRHQIYPVLKELNPSIEETFKDYQYKSNLFKDMVDFAFQTWTAQHVTNKGTDMYIDKHALKNMPTILWLLLKPLGYHVDQIKSIINALDGQSGKQFFAHQHVLLIERSQIIISSSVPHEIETVMIENCEEQAFNGAQYLSCAERERWDKDSEDQAFVDADSISFPIVWRPWKAADYFYPLGLGGRQKVSDFLINAKITLLEKKQVTVLESGGEIVWLVGLRLDDRFKVTDNTHRIVCFQLKS